MKILYLFLMFSTSSVIGIYYGYLMSERERTLIELSHFLKYLLIQIASQTGTLAECVSSYKATKQIKPFIEELLLKLECGCPGPFESSAKNLYALSSEDISFVKSINIGNLDKKGQIRVLENAITYLDEEIKLSSKDEKKRNTISYSGILAGLALVIIFI